MHMRATIVEVSTDSYQGKRGQVVTHVLTLADRTAGTRVKNNLDFMLTDEQAKQFSTLDNEKLQDSPIEIGINDIQPGFGGRMRIKGVVTSSPHYGAQPQPGKVVK